jgi:homoserine acetyltransferase
MVEAFSIQQFRLKYRYEYLPLIIDSELFQLNHFGQQQRNLTCHSVQYEMQLYHDVDLMPIQIWSYLNDQSQQICSEYDPNFYLLKIYRQPMIKS